MKCEMKNVGGNKAVEKKLARSELGNTQGTKRITALKVLLPVAALAAIKLAGCGSGASTASSSDIADAKDVIAMDIHSADVVAKDTLVGPGCNPQAVEYLYIKTKEGKEVIVPNDGTGILNGVKVKVNQDGTIEVEGKVKYGDGEKNVKVTITPKEDGEYEVVAKEAESGDLLESKVVLDSLEFDPSAIDVWTTNTQTKYSSALMLVSGTDSMIVILDGFDADTEVKEVMPDGTSIQVNIKNVMEDVGGNLVLLVDSKVITPTGDVIEEKDKLLVKGGVTGVPGYTVSSTALATVLQIADVACDEIENCNFSVDGDTQNEMQVGDIIELANGYALQITKIVPALNGELGYVEAALLTPEGTQEMSGDKPVVYKFEQGTTVHNVAGKIVKLMKTALKAIGETETVNSAEPTTGDAVSTE